MQGGGLINALWQCRVAADPGIASDCSHHRSHRQFHRPHPDTGRPVCLACHPPAAVYRLGYSDLMRLPVFYLLNAAGGLVASVRANTALEARDLFKDARLVGARVRRADVAG